MLSGANRHSFEFFASSIQYLITIVGILYISGIYKSELMHINEHVNAKMICWATLVCCLGRPHDSVFALLQFLLWMLRSPFSPKVFLQNAAF